MSKIKFKQIERIKINELKEGDVLSYNPESDSFENTYSISKLVPSENPDNTIPVRNHNGNIKVSDAIEDSDAVNLKTLNERFDNIDISGTIRDSETIKVLKDEDTETEVGKNYLEVIPQGLDGYIQKNLDNKLSSCSYIAEDTSKMSIELSRRLSYRSHSKYSPLLLLQRVKSDLPGRSDYDPDIAIDTLSYSREHGCHILAVTGKQTSNSAENIQSAAVEYGQNLFRLSVAGYTGQVNSSTVFMFDVDSASNFSDDVSSVFSIKQAIEGSIERIVSSDSSGNIFLYSGINVGHSDNEQNGTIRFSNSHFQGYNGSRWINLDESAEGSSTEYDNTVTVNCGGYRIGDIVPAGTTIEQLVEKLLAPYSKPMFDDIEVYGNVGTEIYMDDIIECGRSFIPTYANFECIKDSDGGYATDCSISGQGFEDQFQPDEYVEVNSSSIVSVMHNEPYIETWTISGKDNNGNDVSNTYDMKWSYMAYFGASSEEVYDIRSLQQQAFIDWESSNSSPELSPETIKFGGVSFMCTSDNANQNNYTFFALPKMYVDSKPDMIIRRNCLNVTGAFTRTEISLRTDGMESIPYYLYTSNAKGAFSSGNTVRVK